MLTCATLWQPWAELMRLGYKGIETRSWAPPASLLRPGHTLAIHAAVKRSEAQARHWSEAKRLIARYDGRRIVDLFEELPFGAIVAVVVFQGAQPKTDPRGAFRRWVEELHPLERAFGDYSPGRFGWHTAGLVPLREPVECRGVQKLWTAPADVERAVRAQLEEAGAA